MEISTVKKLLPIICLFLLLAAAPAIAHADEYVITSGDLVEVSVWGSPDFSRQVRVALDGKITLPAVGPIDADGLTAPQLQTVLTKAVADYVRSPIVTVSLIEMTNNKVYISGGGVTNGVIALAGNLTLFRLLCQLGSLQDVDLVSAYLARNDKKLLQNFFPLYMQGDLSKDVPLKANDIVHLPSNEFNKVYVIGSVEAPQALTYRYGMNVLDVILSAGGFSEYAKKNNITILGRSGKQRQVDLKTLLSGKDPRQNVPVYPGDYVIVKESIF